MPRQMSRPFPYPLSNDCTLATRVTASGRCGGRCNTSGKAMQRSTIRSQRDGRFSSAWELVLNAGLRRMGVEVVGVRNCMNGMKIVQRPSVGGVARSIRSPIVAAGNGVDLIWPREWRRDCLHGASYGLIIEHSTGLRHAVQALRSRQPTGIRSSIHTSHRGCSIDDKFLGL